MKITEFDYELPPELIAQVPTKHRSESRLLIYERKTDKIVHGRFRDIVEIVPPGDLIVVNSSKVIPARIYPFEGDPKKGEILFVRAINSNSFEALVKPGRKFKIGKTIIFLNKIIMKVTAITPDGNRVFEVEGTENCLDIFRNHGEMPLPPYITSRESSPDRYQTIFAQQEGSIAAPTAGLHFDETTVAMLKSKGVKILPLVLHVGIGTFKPIETEDIESHKMHEEIYEISSELSTTFEETKRNGGSVWACGTTVVRALESAVDSTCKLQVGTFKTNLFIKPGHTFKAVDHLITNFHLPKSTLLVLVSAFCSREKILQLYSEAIKNKYRFYSFGDAMVLI